MRDMKIIITGGAGFIGSHLADRLCAEGHGVLVLDNLLTGERRNLNDDIEFVEGSVTDGVLIRELMEQTQPDLIIHAAGSYKDPDDWVTDSMTNVVGTAHIAQAVKDFKIGRLIYFQTSLCYGLQHHTNPVPLDHHLDPKDTSYAISKTAGEHYIELSGVDHVVFRLANPFGPRNRTGPVPVFYRRLTEGLSCHVTDTRRDFIFVDDLVDCVMRAAGGAGHGIYHIGSGRDYAIKEVYDEMVRALRLNDIPNLEVRPRSPDDAYSILLDVKRTHSELDWRASTPLREAIEKTVKWYSENGIGETFTHLRPPEETKRAT